MTRLKVLRQSPCGLGSWDGNRSLGNHPCQSKLTRGTPLLLRELLELVDNPEVGRKVLLAVPRNRLSVVAVLEIGCALVSSGQDALTERREGDNGDTELLGSIDQTVLLVVGEPRAVLDLQGVDVCD